MREMHPGVVKGPTQIILSPYHEENALGGSKGTHPDNTEPILSKTCIGVVKGPAQIILSPYYEENALGGNKGTHPDNTNPIL